MRASALVSGKVTNFNATGVALPFNGGPVWTGRKNIETIFMNEGKRQKQVGGLLQEEINAIFQRLGLGFVDGAMVSISSVKITPDLLEARIYLSVFNSKDNAAVLKKINERSWEIKKELASAVRQQLRRIPELKFFLDDTLDHVFKMEELFRQIKKDDAGDNKEEGGPAA